jgi:hypothetical protein
LLDVPVRSLKVAARVRIPRGAPHGLLEICQFKGHI